MRVYKLDIYSPLNPVIPLYSLYQGIGKIYNNPVAPNIEFDVPSYQSKQQSERFEVALYNIQKFWSAQNAQEFLWGKRIVVRAGIAKTPLTDRIGLNAISSDLILFGEVLFQGYIHLALPEINGADWIWRIVCFSHNPTGNYKIPFNFSVKKGASYRGMAENCYRYFMPVNNILTFNKTTQIANVDVINHSVDSIDSLNKMLSEYFGDGISNIFGSKFWVLNIAELIGQPQMLSHANVEFTVVLNAKYKVGDTITTEYKYFVGLSKIFETYQSTGTDGILNQQITKNGGVFDFFSNRVWSIYEILHRGKSRNAAPESWVTVIKATNNDYKKLIEENENLKRQAGQSTAIQTQQQAINTAIKKGQ